MLIGGEIRRRRRRPDVRRRRPGHGPDHRHGAARRPRGRGPGRRRGPGGVRRPQGLGELGGRQARPESLAKLADLIKQNSEELAWLESRNVGKPITGARGEVVGASLVFDYYAGAANKVFGQTIPVSKPGLDLTLREPIGVVRADRAVELPDPDGLVEGRARPSPPATPRSSSRRRTRR